MNELAELLRSFTIERDWQQFHSPKNLAMALAGEAGELLAEFQWLTPEQSANLDPQAKAQVAAEMADVLNYLVMLADVLDVDLLAASTAKTAHNALRYPVESHRGSPRKAPPLASEPED